MAFPTMLWPEGSFSASASWHITTTPSYIETYKSVAEWSSWGGNRVRVYRPRTINPNILEYRFTLIADADARVAPIQYYRRFWPNPDSPYNNNEIPHPGQGGTLDFRAHYTTMPVGDTATIRDYGWFVFVGMGYPGSSNSVSFGRFDHPADSGESTKAVHEIALSTCVPIPESIHVYLNGVEQYDPGDWDLMPPDATHPNWWIAVRAPMYAESGDLLEARYACKPGG